MDKTKAKEYIKNLEPSFLDKAKKKVNGHNTYVCPNCGNGSGENGDGIVLIPNNTIYRYKCFKCGINEDIIGLWKIHKKLTSDKEVFDTLYSYYKLQIDDYNLKGSFKDIQLNTHSDNDISTYFKTCKKHLDETDYLQVRGISKSVAEEYNLGYDSKFSGISGIWKAIIPTGM